MMRRKSPERMLLRSTEAMPDAVDRLNKFAEQSIVAFDSLLRSTEFVEVTVTASSELFVVKRNAGEHVASVSVAKVQDVERPIEPVMITSIFWTFQGNDIQAKLDGLTAGRRYNVRFKIVRDEG
tara:strand:- start:902 stop:1273 length:372 start_codon:yes stop_codon:yes gene_type:complete